MIKVIKNGYLVTMENEHIIKGDVVIEDDIIKQVVDNYRGAYDEIIDAKGNLVMPGLINAHTHLGMYNFRNTNDDLTLMQWLNDKIWPIENKMTDDEVGEATYLSCLEMIKSGTTCCFDHYFSPFAVLKALTKSKIRCLYATLLMDHDNKGEERLEEFKQFYKQVKNQNSLITFGIGLHSLYTSSSHYVNKVAKYAKENKLPIHLHYLENKEEYQKVNKEALKPLLTNKLILAHGVYLKEVDFLKNKDISIVHNPISNLALGCGIADIINFKRNNLNVCLGTDGVGSAYTLNMFKHLPFAYLLQKGIYEDPTVIKAFDILKMATINGAKGLGIPNLGLIKEGYKADLIIVKLLDEPVNNPLIALLTNNTKVITTIVNGEVLMLDGCLNKNLYK